MYYLKGGVIKDYFFMIIENLEGGFIEGLHRMYSLKECVIKEYLFMIIENLEGGSVWGRAKGFSEGVQ
jgi:hypothetical protein